MSIGCHNGDISGMLGTRKSVNNILKNDLEHIARKVHPPNSLHGLIAVNLQYEDQMWYFYSWETEEKDSSVCGSGFMNVHSILQTLRERTLRAKPHAKT